MENKWPPLEECVQYKLGLLGPYLQNFPWEHDDGDETQFEYQTGDEGEGGDGDGDEYDSSHKVEVEIEDEDDSSDEVEDDSSHEVEDVSSHEVEDDSYDEAEDDSSDEAEDDSSDGGYYVSRRKFVPPSEFVSRRRNFRFRYKPSTLRKFVKQVRESRGYDFDVGGLPRFMCNPFIRYNEYGMRSYKKWANVGIELAIKEINSKTGKVYKHVDTLVFVVALCNHVFLLTFTAKVIADKEVDPETFLATVYSPGRAVEKYELLECLLKPEGPAPWTYEERRPCCV